MNNDKGSSVFSDMLRGRAQEFLRGTPLVEDYQRDLLKTVLHSQAKTAFGIQHDFSSIRSIEEFQKRVPISNYEQISDVMCKAKLGESTDFCAEPSLCFAWSSGTSSAAKCLAVTKGLQRDFCEALIPWFDDLSQTYTGLFKNTGYWVLGPRLSTGSTEYADDLSFVGEKLGAALKESLLFPSWPSPSNFRHWALGTWLLLGIHKELRWLSFWSPSLLVDFVKSASLLKEELEKLLLQDGSFHAQNAEEHELSTDWNHYLAGNSIAARAFFKVLNDWDGQDYASLCRKLWPQLQLVSCWKNAWASLYIPELTKLLPMVKIQGKGLLATEGVVTIPLEFIGAESPILAYRSHFFEFSNNGNVYCAWELQAGKLYEVLLTTSAGLYRYRLGDLVQLSGYYGKAPRLDFVNKLGIIADLAGEKLNEDFVISVLSQVQHKFGICLSGSELKPIVNCSKPYYELQVYNLEADQLVLLAAEIERELLANPHYRYCREMAQLGPVIAKLAQKPELLSSTHKSTVLSRLNTSELHSPKSI